MNRYKLVLAVFLTALLIAFTGCSNQTDSSTGASPETGAATVSITFPTSNSSVQPAGVPWGAEEALVTITDSAGGTVATVTLTPDAPSQEVTLPLGIDLTFTTSVMGSDYGGGDLVEIAWGSQTQQVQDGDVIQLGVRGIISDFYVNGPYQLYYGVKSAFSVQSHAPNGAPVGPDDYLIECTATAASCTAGVGIIEVVPDGNSSQVTITVTVTGLMPDHTEGSLSRTDSFPASDLSDQADISITKTVDNQSVSEGDQVVFTITATNVGPVDMSGVVVNDILPAGLVYVDSSADAGSYDPTTGVWQIGDLTSAAQATLTITATVDSDTSGKTITNTATLDTTNISPGDNDDSNNQSSISVYVDIQTGSATLAGDAIPPGCYFEEPSWGTTYALGEEVPIKIHVWDDSDGWDQVAVEVYIGSTPILVTIDTAGGNDYIGYWTATNEYWGEQALTGIVHDPNDNSNSCSTTINVGN